MAARSTYCSDGMALLMAYHKNPSIPLRNRIVRLNRGLVRKVAHRMRAQCTEPYEDLEQIGYLGLIHAIERFDPSQGCAFSSFAVPYIRGEILHFLRDRANTVRIPRRWQDLYKEGQKVRERLVIETGHQPRETEIAQALGVSVQEWREVQLSARNRTPLSLDAVVSPQTDSVATLGDTIPDCSEQARQSFEEEQQQLRGALDQLEGKTRAVIEFVFLKGLSRKEVAEQIGVSPMTVTRWIQRGIQDMIITLQTPTLPTDSYRSRHWRIG